MPGRFGQKILDAFNAHVPHSAPHVPHETRPLPGELVVQNDERFVSSQHGNGTYPRLAWLPDGSILSSFTRFNGPSRSLMVARSTDGARSFVDWGEVTVANNDVDNMYVCAVSPPGTVIAAFRNHDLGPSGPTWFRITVCESNDWGRTWHYLTQAAEKPAPMGIWEPFMRIGKQGEVQMTFSQEFTPTDQRTMMVKSFDQGKSWSQPVCIEGAHQDQRDGMTGITRTFDNGREALVMVFETTKFFPHFNVEAVISYDDGNTWQNRHDIYVPPRGRSAGSPQIAVFGDGSMAVSFMTDDDVSDIQWPFRAAVKIAFATAPQDGRIRWTAPRTVCREPGLWPGIFSLDPTRVLVTYDQGGPKCKTITWNHR